METSKIAAACFIGGALCCAIALISTPAYWWLGLIAGFFGGYISYEFREVYRAIPNAMRAVGKDSFDVGKRIVVQMKTWFSRPHPFFYPAAIVATPFYLWSGYYVAPSAMELISGPGSLLVTLFMMVIIAILAFVEIACVVMALIYVFTCIGASFGEDCYFLPSISTENTEDAEQKLEARELRCEPLTYRNVARWFVKGTGLAIPLFVWALWKIFATIITIVWGIICFSSQFSWYLFKLVHSRKRVLCGIDGMLGGLVSYIWLASSSVFFSEQAILVVFGGLLGAGFGVINWEVVSKRVLHVACTGV